MTPIENHVPEINSREWWDWYFEENWDNFGGPAQTTHFMQRLIANLPAPLLAYLRSAPRTVLDWGCAFGDGVHVLSGAFPNCQATGLDASEAAIVRARSKFPAQQFIHEAQGAIVGRYDVIVTSNCLEHFDNPVEWVEVHLKSAGSYYALLVPFEEWPLHASHKVRLDLGSFPETVGDFRRIHAAPVEVEPVYWPGLQLLVLYERR